jgi:hypothetical protein
MDTLPFEQDFTLEWDSAGETAADAAESANGFPPATPSRAGAAGGNPWTGSDSVASLPAPRRVVRRPTPPPAPPQAAVAALAAARAAAALWRPAATRPPSPSLSMDLQVTARRRLPRDVAGGPPPPQPTPPADAAAAAADVACLPEVDISRISDPLLLDYLCMAGLSFPTPAMTTIPSWLSA